MKKIFLIFIIAFFCCIFFGYRNNDPRIIISNLVKKGGDLKAGEFKYRIYLLGIFPVGEAVFSTAKVEEYRGKRVYHLNATAQSLKLFSKIFSGFAVLDSYVNMEQLNPVLFRQKLSISGKQDSDKEIIYDQKNEIMSIGGLRRQIFPNTQDSLSAAFNLIRLDLSKVKEIEMNINTNQKNYILKASISGQDVWADKTRYRIFLAKADIYRRDHNPYHKSKVTMLLVKEKENIPVLIKIFSGGLLISAKLVDIN